MRILLFSVLLVFGFSTYAQKVSFSEWKNLTTSGKLPAECKLMHSNNNLDLAKYKGKYYLAFRTAPTHYASRKVKLYVVSSYDLDKWEFESEIWLDREMREPRFAVYHDTLNLYFFTGGTSIFKFEPRQLMVCRSIGGNFWSKPQSIGMDGFVPWRLREHNDTLYLSAYDGRNLYNSKHKADLRLFYSTNATAFRRYTTSPQIDADHAEEGEFIFDKRGDLYATVRLEGAGSLICHADRANIGHWTNVRSKYKYDSALLFDHEDDIYLVSRRNIDGPMNKSNDTILSKRQRLRNLIRYWFTTKVTALYKLNKKDLSISLVADLPSTGDTAFPGIVKLDDGSYLLMNYSSNIAGHKKNWFFGQLGKTYIYWTKLAFEQ
jgi:hypothetical protein